MKILVVSDSHGNIKRLVHVFGFAKRSKIGAIIHCGDWDNPQAAETAQGLGIPIYSVLGNADFAKSKNIKAVLKRASVKVAEETLKLTLGGRKIVVNHFPWKVKEEVKKDKYDIAFNGHWHKRSDTMVAGTRIVHPGALHQTNQPSFAVYDTKTNSVEFIDIAF